MERMGMKPPSGTTRGLTGLPTPHRRRGLGDQSSVTADNESQLRNIIAKVLSSDSRDLLKVLTELNHTLSTRTNPVIEPFVAADGVKAIIKKLTEPQTCAIYLEAVRALSNVACGTSEQAKAIVNSRGVEAICNLLRTKSGERPELCEQCLQALANIAGQNSTLRDTLLDYEVIDLLGDLYQEVQHLSWLPYFSTQVVRSLTWLMSNLCQSQPPPPINKIVGAFDCFAEILNSCDDMQTINEACMGLSHFFAASDSEKEQLDFIREMLASWEVTGEDLQQRWNQIPAVARAKRCAKRLQEAGGPTPDRFLRLLNTARGWMPNELSPVDEDSPCGETTTPPMDLDEKKPPIAGGYSSQPTLLDGEKELPQAEKDLLNFEREASYPSDTSTDAGSDGDSTPKHNNHSTPKHNNKNNYSGDVKHMMSNGVAIIV